MFIIEFLFDIFILNIKQMKLICFLDILGFGNVTIKNINNALELISDYQTIINLKITDEKTHPILKITNEDLLVDSFETFLPFSDSIFITSTIPEKFIKQVSHFLIHSFQLNAEQYTNPESKENPLSTNINIFKSTSEITTINIERSPLLFRGGVSYGEVESININSIINNEISTITNLTGKALVESVKLEKSGKGPRVFCNKSLIDNLSEECIEKYIGTILKDELYEIYWPSLIYIDDNSFEGNIKYFDTLFIPATNLWKAFNHLDYGIHYYEFIKLIVQSTLKYFKFNGDEIYASNYITEKIKFVGLYEKTNDLMNNM